MKRIAILLAGIMLAVAGLIAAPATALADTCVISFDPNCGEGNIAPVQCNLGETYQVPDNTGFSYPGHVFIGWNTAADGSGVSYSPGDTFTVRGNMTLFAQWKYALTADNVTLSWTEKAYSGDSQVPEVKYYDLTLNQGVDYIVELYLNGGSIGSAVDVGDYTLIITGIGAFRGEVGKEFTISPKTVTLHVTDFSKRYGDSDPRFDYTVDGLVERDGVMDELDGVDISRAAGDDVGEYAITATVGAASNPNYTVIIAGTGTLTITAFPLTDGGVLIDVLSSVEYAGSPVTPEVVVKALGKKLVKDTDYTLDYTSNDGPGTGKVTVKGKGNFQGEVDKEFTITAPPTATLTITYVYANGGEAAATYSKDYAVGTGFDVASPVIEHYTADVATVTGTMGDGGATVKVTYTGDPATITLDLGKGELDGQTGTIEIPAHYGDIIYLPTGTPTLAGHTFVNWKGSEYNPGDEYTVTGDHTLTAVYKKNQPTIPDTGDAAPLALALALLVVSGAGFAFARKRG